MDTQKSRFGFVFIIACACFAAMFWVIWLFVRISDARFGHTSVIGRVSLVSNADVAYTVNGRYNDEFSEDQRKIHDEVDFSEFDHIMPVRPGTKWVYEGARGFLFPGTETPVYEKQKRIVEITGVEQDGDALVVHQMTTIDDVNMSGQPNTAKRTVRMTRNSFDFGGGLVSFPLRKGQYLQEVDEPRDDNLYVLYVSNIMTKQYFGKSYRCYDISDNVLSASGVEVFCEGLGYVQDMYVHHGSVDEWDYRLTEIVLAK